MERRTISRKLRISGIGLHGGRPSSVILQPGREGIIFRRREIQIPARLDHVVDTTLNTTLGSGGARISTVEHLMACLYGTGITDCEIELEGDEVPALDGSARELVRMIRASGTRVLEGEILPIVVPRRIRLESGASWIEASPGSFEVTYEIDFPDASIGYQRYCYSGRDFAAEIAPARTFGRMQDVEKMRSLGYALGGSLRNAVVVDGHTVLNPEGLRFPEEFVRHKILDLLGDLWILGRPVEARIHAYKANHGLHIGLAGKILEAGLMGA
ncbi:MAG: UDP-3-O-acyl-N-acetylglucosamine deacetylase [Desulfomonilia bacterium]|nr:UDP-3-O-acyl-N-acetylglucosamine deacetylase [Desulfomonilia bacterium]